MSSGPICIRLAQYSQQVIPKAGAPSPYNLYVFEAVRDKSERLWQGYNLSRTEILYDSPIATRCVQLVIDFVAHKLIDMGHTVEIFHSAKQTRYFGFYFADRWDLIRELTLKALSFLLDENTSILSSPDHIAEEINKLRRENAALTDFKRKLDEIAEIIKK